VPIVLRDDLKAIMTGKQLLDAGVYVNPVVHLAVPRDGAMLRAMTQASATHAIMPRASRKDRR
jgi:7-keto-8-aminopelargonate synthetase-like enzyme